VQLITQKNKTILDINRYFSRLSYALLLRYGYMGLA
jgi:hypothetical protein